ncbi:MAG: DUF1801 domain-containing protein [Pirellulales bacterium]
MQSSATSVAAYLKTLPPERRASVEAVRKVILQNLDAGFAEGMQYGMIGYFVPHRIYPAGYHCNPQQPLPFAGLASQKNYLSLYLMSIYGEGPHWNWFREAWAKTGKKLDMGKCCIRFKRAEDLALDVIGEALRRTTAKEYIARYEEVLGQMRSRPKGRPAPAAKTGQKSTARPATKKKPARATKAARPKTKATRSGKPTPKKKRVAK